MLGAIAQKGKIMFSIKVQYDISEINPMELQAVKNDFYQGMSYAQVEDKYEDFRVVWAAIIECARELGWDMENYIKENQIEETMYLYFAFGETQPKVWRGFMMLAALNYMQEKICA